MSQAPADETKNTEAVIVTSGGPEEQDPTPQEQKGAEDKEAEQEEEEEEKTVSPFYATKLPNRVVISRGRRNRRFVHGLQFYVERTRRILRTDDTVSITGVDVAITTACTLVEILKRQRIAELASVDTRMNVSPMFTADGSLEWGPAVPTINIVLKAGPHAKYVSDFRQRKVIEIFESHDPEHTGKLDKKTVMSLDLPKAFFAPDDLVKKAEEYLQGIAGDTLTLPDFIKYASVCIHPLLKNGAFKHALANSYNISGTEVREDN